MSQPVEGVLVRVAAGTGVDAGVEGEGGGFTPRKVLIIGLIFLYIAAYQISFGPIAWLLISELFPLEVRGQAVALAVQANFASNTVWKSTSAFGYPENYCGDLREPPRHGADTVTGITSRR